MITFPSQTSFGYFAHPLRQARLLLLPVIHSPMSGMDPSGDAHSKSRTVNMVQLLLWRGGLLEQGLVLLIIPRAQGDPEQLLRKVTAMRKV